MHVTEYLDCRDSGFHAYITLVDFKLQRDYKVCIKDLFGVCMNDIETEYLNHYLESLYNEDCEESDAAYGIYEEFFA